MDKKNIKNTDEERLMQEKITKKKNINKSLIILCCIVLIIPLFIIGRFYAIQYILPTPQRTINRYFDYIAQEDYDRAYKLLRDPFKATRGEGIEDFIAMFELSRNHGTIYQGAKVLRVMDTDRRSVKLVSFELIMREKGRPTAANGAYYLERCPDTKIWYIVDSQM